MFYACAELRVGWLHPLLVKFCVCPSFPFGIEGGMLDVIVLVPDHCLSVYFILELVAL